MAVVMIWTPSGDDTTIGIAAVALEKKVFYYYIYIDWIVQQEIFPKFWACPKPGPVFLLAYVVVF
jgi:hypothetical protein